jgi:hypothetical protein
MATSKPGYGAIPSTGHVLTSNGMNGSSWSMQHTNAVQIGNPDPIITFKLDGNIVTKAGTITADDWISVIKVMKQLIMDMSQDEELVSKYPYIRDAAHIWMMNKLKGKDNGENESE